MSLDCLQTLIDFKHLTEINLPQTEARPCSSCLGSSHTLASSQALFLPIRLVHLAHFGKAQGSTINTLEHQTSYLVESIFERLLVNE